MNRVPAIIEGLCYILTKIHKADKIHLVKLMYLSDKYHLMNYGRTITGDDFFAFQNGPGGSQTMNVLDFDPYVLKEDMNQAEELLKTKDGQEYTSGKKCLIDDFGMLSESDIESIDFAINNFGTMDKWDVVDYTHKLPEWKRFESLFKQKRTKREVITITDILLGTEKEFFSMPKEHIEESLQIATGCD